MKKKIVAYGNCQMTVLADALKKHPAFTQRFEIYCGKPVHLQSDYEIECFPAYVEKADIFIYQSVGNYRDNPTFNTIYLSQFVSPCTQCISIPSLYFSGYTPNVNHLTYSDGSRQDTCLIAYSLLAKGMKASEIASFLEDVNLYSASLSREILNLTISELKGREFKNNNTITVSEFISDSFKTIKMFYIPIHPAKTVLDYVLNEILLYVGLDQNSELVPIGALDSYEFNILPSVAKNMEIHFDCLSLREFYWRFNKQTMTVGEYVESLAETISNSSADLVLQNLAEINNRFRIYLPDALFVL